MIPQTLQDQIQTILQSLPSSSKLKLHETVSNRYRSSGPKGLISTEEAIIYLTTRIPATYAVGKQVLDIFKEIYGNYGLIKSILDVGAGPGTSRWLFSDVFPSLQRLTLVECNSSMIQVGEKLHHPLGEFTRADYRRPASLPQSDLVFLSYTLSELQNKDLHQTIKLLWQKALKGMILIEPGTPQGFEAIKQARIQLIQEGAFILAPCGHESSCPINSPDWCHFSCRLPRTAEHQRLKKGSRPFEDEKFSYVIASKTPSMEPLLPRLVRPLLKRKGHVSLDTCTSNGIQRQTISSSHPSYKDFKEMTWGSPVPSSTERIET